MRLKPECVDQYKECHARVWPEVLKVIKECGIEDCALPILSPSSKCCFGKRVRGVWVRVGLMLVQLTDSIFHDKDTQTLFASFKYVGYNYAGDMERMRENAKVREWWAMTDGMQESFVEGATGSTGEEGWWKGLEEVFYAA